MTLNLLLSATDYTTRSANGSGSSAVATILYIAVVVAVIAGIWRMFSKAGQPGWAAIIPIYNIVVLMRVAGRPAWWTLLYFIPIVNFIISLIVGVDVAKHFGKNGFFGAILCGLLTIGYIIVGFDSSTYDSNISAA